MMSNRKQLFYRNFFIYTIGNLGSKFINIALFPIFSFFITPKQMGFFDLSIVFIYLAIPIVTLNIKEGAFRFFVDPGNENKSQIAKYTMTVILSGIIMTTLLMTMANLLYPIPYFGWLLPTVISFIAYEIYSHSTRGIGKTYPYIIAGILNTLITALVSIILVIGYKMDIRAVFAANIISRIFCIIYLDQKIHFVKTFLQIRGQNRSLNKAILRYSMPLLPNFIAFWIIDNSSRVFIEHFLGIEQNGLYAIISKFSNILSTFTYIFYLTWQEMAMKQYQSSDRNLFFSRMFNYYFLILSLMAVIIGNGINLVFPYIVDNAYAGGQIYVYPLLVSVVFFGLSFFMDIPYQCSKQTEKSLPSILTTAILVIVLNYVLVRTYNMAGIIASSAISYIYLTVFRLIDTRKIISIKPDRYSVISILILASGFVVYYSNSIFITSVYLLVMTIYAGYILYGLYTRRKTEAAIMNEAI